MKKYFCCILLIFLASNLLDANPLRERIYMQTDKRLYLAGELVLIKVLTTDQNLIPLDFSKIAYVELVGDTIARLQIMIELTNGTGSGQMQLPAELPTGYYRLIAYTQFMRNEGADVFFEKNIAVLNTFLSDFYPTETETRTERHFTPVVNSDFATVSLQTNKATYTTRERGELVLTGLPDNIHTLSVSIAGRELMPATESSASLFRRNRAKNSTVFSNEFLPEYEGHIIRGKIIDNQIEIPDADEEIDENFIASITAQLNVVDSLLQVLQQLTLNQQTHNTIELLSSERVRIAESLGLTDESASERLFSFPVLSIPGEGIRFFAGQRNQTDDVLFFTTGISGATEIATVLYHTDGKYRIDILSPFVNRYVPHQMPALHIDSSYYGQLLERSVALQLFHYFSEDPSANQNIPEPFFKAVPTWSYPLDEYTRFTTMREVFVEFITGARFRRNAGRWEISILTRRGNFLSYGTMPLVLLDGVPIADHGVIFNYDPLAVEIINIYYGPIVMGGYFFDGIVELITYRRLHQNLVLDRSSQVLSYEGPQLPFLLDAPDYSNINNRQSRIPDGRHTLLWNPDVRTDGNTSITLPFDTSDLTGEFQATIEGVTKDGQFIFATTVFKVER